MRTFRRREGIHARRRHVLAYALSIVVHVFAFAFFIIRALLPSGAAEPKETTTRSFAFTQDRAVQKRVAPTIAPTLAAVVAQATPAPQPTLRPVTPPRPIFTPKPITRRTRPRRPELAKIVAHAPAQAERIAVLAPIVTAPATVAPTMAPTTAPTVAPTEKPMPAPTAGSSLAPTIRPTIAPRSKGSRRCDFRPRGGQCGRPGRANADRARYSGDRRKSAACRADTRGAIQRREPR